MPAYDRPARLEDALRILARERRVLLAGGTDYFPAHVGRPLDDAVVDLSALKELRGIRELSDYWRIGATTTWTQVIETKLPALFDGLKLAAREVGGRQIQNSGTVAGNLCNASPAADGVPPLLALDAVVELASAKGERALPLAEFILGPRRTALAPDEIMLAVRVPKPAHVSRSGFLKLGARRYLVISIAMASGVLAHDAGVVRAARIAVGACSPVARRLPGLERALVGRRMDASLADGVEPAHLAPLTPIDDLRGSAAYRVEAVQVLVRRLLAQMT